MNRFLLFVKKIVDYARGEEIEVVVIGNYMEDRIPQIRTWYMNVVLTPKKAKRLLSYKPCHCIILGLHIRCHVVYVYTTTCIFFVSQYNSFTTFNSILQNPTNVQTIMLGDWRIKTYIEVKTILAFRLFISNLVWFVLNQLGKDKICSLFLNTIYWR